MPDFRRYHVAGGTFFFTVITARRARLFGDEEACRWLGECFREERQARPFRVEAIVLLPDHLHAIWTLPRGDSDYSTRWSAIKSAFTRRWLRAEGAEQAVPRGHRREGRRGVWQARFIEHTIRDEDDFIHHVEYIHYNPVKHGLVRCPRDWSWSSFHRHAKLGFYPIDWGCSEGLMLPSLDRVRSDLLE